MMVHRAMELHISVQRCLLPVLLVLVILLGCTVDAYMSPSCRRCVHSGDWASCTACYTSKSGIVPFYGMGKRGGGEMTFSSEEEDDSPLGYDMIPSQEVRKRGSSLAEYCCMRFGDDHCCAHSRFTPYYGKRSASDYDVLSADGCDLCRNEDTFDFSYCLRCLRRK